MTPASKHIFGDPDARIVVAHRGNRVGAAENTLESLTQAVELGADAIEFDVRVTRDGVPVILHDPDLDRTTNGHGRLNAYSFEEVRTLNAAVRAPGNRDQRLQIPSLEEVLDRFRETPLVIEVKELAAADATESLIRRFGAQERVLLGSSVNAVTERFYRSGLRACASGLDASIMIPLAFLGISPGRRRYDVLSVTPTYYGLPIPVRRMAAAARKAGIPTQVWTVNDPVKARELWSAGVSGIVTDDPAAMIRARAQ
jgi:glycerophosphoryl diester phosphodiesterase